jgi:large subunit ribosomal protein L18
MSLERKIRLRTARRAQRVRSRIVLSGAPRICVFRSLNHIYAQIIDDTQGKTVVSCSSLELKKLEGSKKDKAYAVGKELAQRALQHGIKRGVVDRGSFLYHGRVEALTQGLREGGLQV